jgi:ribosomal protein S18 acetylase RimI-like enzyme
MESVRDATVADLGTLVEFAGELSAELGPLRGGALWTRRDARPEPLREAFTALLDDPDAVVLVGCIDGTPVGFAVMVLESLRDGGSLARITELHVLADARGIGVGEAVVAELLARASARGCVGVDAPALPGHRAAKNFFEGQGFTARLLTMHRPL